LTDRPAAFISAMEKLTRLNLIDPDPPALVKLLLYSHPPVRERIAAARAYQRVGSSGPEDGVACVSR
jgi:STE24 endopeptidase